MTQIALAPMEGLADAMLRDLLTAHGGIDWCVTEFVRISDRLLPAAAIQRIAPELKQGSVTAAGTELRVQLLGSDPVCMAENAAQIAELGAAAIDLNFGCPAKTVNKSRGGAILLKEPERLYRIAAQIRASVPAKIPVTAKMRLGYEDTGPALDCARAFAQGGVEQLVVHARTPQQGYKPPAQWEWIGKIQDVVRIPVIANGDIWSLQDWLACRAVSGAESVMLGRGMVSRPDLARQIKAFMGNEEYHPLSWQQLLPTVTEFWRRVRETVSARHAPGRLKQWLVMLGRCYPEARLLFEQLRQVTDAAVVDFLLQQGGRQAEN